MSGPQSSGIGNSPLSSPLVSFLSQVSLEERNLACDRWFLRLSLIQYPWLHHHYVLRQGHPAPQTPGPWRLSLWQSILMLGSGLNLTVCASNLTVSAPGSILMCPIGGWGPAQTNWAIFHLCLWPRSSSLSSTPHTSKKRTSPLWSWNTHSHSQVRGGTGEQNHLGQVIPTLPLAH